MIAALRENWTYKLLALVCAIALHTYVIGQNNAGQPRMLILPLTIRNAPNGLLVNEKALPQISVTLDGPAEEMDRIADTSVTASVDLSHARAGQTTPLPVHIALPTGTSSLVTADPQPMAVPVRLETKARRRLPIIATEPGTPPAGYAFRTPQITPLRANVEGPHDAVADVQQLVIKADEETIGTIDDTFPIIALDSEGTQVEGVTITPPTAHILIEMVRVPVIRALLVSPDVTGAPVFPARVTNVQVSPPTLLVTGRSDRLAQVGTISTIPIDVAGATQDIVRQVRCLPPSGLKLVGPEIVTVTVRISQPAPATPLDSTPPAPAVSTLPSH